MKFNELVQYLLDEARGVDPMKFAYRGAPMGLRKDTGISNPEKFVPTNKGPGDKGKYISAENRRLISMAVLVAMSDARAGMELKSLIKHYGELYFNYVNSKQEAQAAMDRYDKLPRKDTDLALELKERAKEYNKIAERVKLSMESESPEIITQIQELIRDGSSSFVKTLQTKPEYQIKSLKDLDTIVANPEDDKVIEFLKDIYRGKSEFEPLSKFVTFEKEEGKDPLFDLTTIYKSMSDLAVRKGLVGSPEKIFDHLAGTAKQVRSIVEPTKGRMMMKQKDPGLMKVIALIKKQKYNEAKNAVNDTKLENNQKADLMTKIEKLSKGEVTEADVIRPLYAA